MSSTESRRMRRSAALLCAALAAATPAHAVIQIVVVDADSPGEGFKDPTPVAPVGGNTGTTLGQQRLNVIQQAANQWAVLLGGNATIEVEARFDQQTCSTDGATLGSAGAQGVQANFPAAPRTNVWYPDALANALRGVDGSPVNAEIDATFNVSIDSGCLGGAAGWWYGVDPAIAAPADRVPLLPVAFHELGHGLGFASLVNESTGQLLAGRIDTFSTFIRDLSNGLSWEAMNNGLRAASAINDPNLVFSGPNVTAQQGAFLRSPSRLTINSPAGIAGNYPAQMASYGPSPPPVGLTGAVALATDGVGPAFNDGCTAFTNAGQIAGRIALVDRGNCNFTVKSKNAQLAGAIGVLVANNVASPPLPPMGGTDSTVAIASYGITEADGTLIKANLGGGGVNATLGYDGSQPLAGTNGGFVRLHGPNPVDPGSSVSHFTADAEPNLLMEPAINSNLFDQVDLTLPAFQDIGWQVISGPPPNQPPTVAGPASIAVFEDTPSALTGISFADPDAGAGNVTATFSVMQGAVSATAGIGGVAVGGSGTARTITGSIANLNNYIANGNVRYTTATDSLTAQTLVVTINDNGNSGAGGAQSGNRNITLNVTAVNDAPVVTALSAYTVVEDVATTIGSITVSDLDAGANAVLLTAQVSTGSLGASAGGGVGVTGSGSAGVMLSGTISAINTYIAGGNLRYTTALDSTTSANLNVTVSDLGNTGSGGQQFGTDIATIGVTAVNDPPSVGAPAGYTVDEDATLTLSGIAVADVDSGAGSVQLTALVSGGTLTTIGSGVTVVGAGSSSVTLTGNVAAMNAFLLAGNLRYVPPANGSAAATLDLTVSDLGNTGGGALTASDSATITVTALNDAPVVSGPALIPALLTGQTGITGVSFADADAGNGTVTVTWMVSTGTMNATASGGVSVAGSATASMLTSGTLADLNAFVAAGSVSFETPGGITDDVILSITANDNGNTPAPAQAGNRQVILSFDAIHRDGFEDPGQ